MATRSEVEMFSIEEVKEFISSQLNGVVQEDSLETLQRNRIAGKAFLQLDDEELRELFPLIGERKAIKNLICSYKPKQVSVHVVDVGRE